MLESTFRTEIHGTCKERSYCTYCNKPSHLVEKCWVIHENQQTKNRVLLFNKHTLLSMLN